jgi:ATP adenylyltransferase/5',5'''-P-1,P-4-tetraphosphate phosphorylase II
MWIAELEIEFENGSTGAKQFQSTNKTFLEQEVFDFVKGVIDYAKAKQKNLVKRHKVHVKQL